MDVDSVNSSLVTNDQVNVAKKLVLQITAYDTWHIRVMSPHLQAWLDWAERGFGTHNFT
jgi:hypothetical protein